jgi:hypothetical protein
MQAAISIQALTGNRKMMIQKEQIVLNLNQSIQKTIHTQEFQG